MKFNCKCGHAILGEHGSYDKCKEGVSYHLFYCIECKSSIKVNKQNYEDFTYGNSLENKNPV